MFDGAAAVAAENPIAASTRELPPSLSLSSRRRRRRRRRLLLLLLRRLLLRLLLLLLLLLCCTPCSNAHRSLIRTKRQGDCAINLVLS